MEDFKSRLVVEEKDLNSKVEKLSSFMESDRYRGLSHIDQMYLKHQLVDMRGYLSTLRLRMKRLIK